MRSIATAVIQSNARVRQAPTMLGLVTLLLVVGGFPSSGQESRPTDNRPPSATATVLNADFAGRLHDPGLAWPTQENIRAVASRDTEYGRYDAARWQKIILSEPFRAAPFGGRPVREEGTEFTAGVNGAGYDAVYHRWETERYRLQFCCTRGMIFVMVAPKAVEARAELSADEVKARAVRAVSEIVRRGPQLLANSSMELEPTEYGQLVRFQQTPDQVKSLSRDTTNRERKVEPGAISDTGDEWLTFMKIRTDGYSFVFDFPKMGVGPAAPSPDKTWFKERKPAEAPAP